MEKSVHDEAQKYFLTFLFVEWKQREKKIKDPNKMKKKKNETQTPASTPQIKQIKI